MNIGILLLRLAVGFTLTAHGSQKLFGWFGGPGLNSTGQFFEERLGFRPGRRHALLAGLAEAGGGSPAGAWAAHASWGSSCDQCYGRCRFQRPHPEGFFRAQPRI